MSPQDGAYFIMMQTNLLCKPNYSDAYLRSNRIVCSFVTSVRSSNSHPDLLVIHPLFQITPVLNTGL